MEHAVIQLPKRLVESLDLLVEAGVFHSREEAAEAAIRRFIKLLEE